MAIPFHAKTVTEVLRSQQSRPEGLSVVEAARRLEKQGKNELPRERAFGALRVLASQFASPMVVILLVAALVSAALTEWVDVGVILAAVGVNAIIGFVQEYKAGRALERLRALVQPHAKALRSGKQVDIAATEIVPGDVIVLAAGDRVAADARVIEAIELEVNEAALTGESLPVKKAEEHVEKGAPLAERSSMVYAGTTVVGGRGLAAVIATATSTEIGKIAELVKTTDATETPLQAELKRLARWISVSVVLLVAALFVIGLLYRHPFAEMFETSVALAVAAIPEGLVVAVTIILAIGMQRVLRRRSLLRQLVAAETLGSVSVICTDKTGTITEGRMRATDFLDGSGDKLGARDRKRLMQAITLCNDATVIDGEEQGSPTERALLAAAREEGVDPDMLGKSHERLGEIPFDSAKKFMATLNAWGKSRAVIVKGAPERVIAMCEGGKREHARLETVADELADRGLRVLAVAMRTGVRAQKLGVSHLERLAFIGFVGLKDPLRKGTRAQVRATARAGVHTVMVTGDHPSTAAYIAREAGLAGGSASEVATGADLDAWDDAELKRRVAGIHVFARVEPRHKIRIVRAWQARGEVVSMTGDGVNDAPALKAADIGVAVGSGTEVAKQASDMVVLDNNLGTIAAAIHEGRVVFDNIRKVTVYLLADSFTEIVLIGGSILMGLPLPLTAAQILWINLVADSFPNVGLTLEPAEPDVMDRKPRRRGEPVLDREMLSIIFIIGIVTDIALFALYAWLLGATDDPAHVGSVMFAAVGIDSLIYVFAVKSFRRTIFRINPFSNPWLLLGVGIGLALMLLALLHPFFQMVFEVAPLRAGDWGLLLALAVMKLVAIELAKEWFIVKERHVEA